MDRVTVSWRHKIAILLAVLLSMVAAPASVEDSDRDSLSDDFEQALLVQFAPAFQISAGDCAEAPAEFLPGSRKPQVVARNGTIYGQVSKATAGFLEIHYYHLRSRDCGRLGHALDAEHVSALIRASDYKAVYWFAAAHQETVCDASSAAPAATLDAEDHGPTVWISRGKHASFLSLESCSRGCGGDRARRWPLSLAESSSILESGAPS